jgi:hypothetical protein
MILLLSGKDSYDVDEVMEYAPDMDHVEQSVEEYVFDDNDEEYKNINEENDSEDIIITDTAVLKPCLTDLSKVGWSQLSSKDVKKVRMHAKEREKRKQDTAAYIMARVANMKSMSVVISLPIEKSFDVIPLWAQYMEEKQPNNYIM